MSKTPLLLFNNSPMLSNLLLFVSSSDSFVAISKSSCFRIPKSSLGLIECHEILAIELSTDLLNYLKSHHKVWFSLLLSSSLFLLDQLGLYFLPQLFAFKLMSIFARLLHRFVLEPYLIELQSVSAEILSISLSKSWKLVRKCQFAHLHLFLIFSICSWNSSLFNL